jgi:apolipoprotein D and lipocalin family protein
MSRLTSLVAVIALLAAPGVALTQPEDAAASRSEPVQAVPSVDLARYAGLWYEQAHLPLFFQRNCVANTTARYSVRDDGRIDVVNQCDTDKGKRIESTAIARKVDGSSSKLEVRFAPAFLSFIPAIWGDYWIIDLDPDYQWAVVGSPDRKYLWFLTRDKTISPEQYDALVAKARAQGYDTSELIRTEQGQG